MADSKQAPLDAEAAAKAAFASVRISRSPTIFLRLPSFVGL